MQLMEEVVRCDGVDVAEGRYGQRGNREEYPDVIREGRGGQSA